MSTLLCIDDEPSILTLHKTLFEALGYQVFTAPGGAEGIRFVRDRQADLVILDYKMSDMTGAEVAESIRRLHPALPIVMVSAYPNLPGSVLKHVNAYLVKGEPIEVLIKKVRSLLQRAA
jgi:two-component system, OmpR family, response regulator MprA